MKDLRVEVQMVLEKHFAGKLGVKVGGANFSNSNCTFKIEFADIGANGVVESKQRTDYKLYAKMYGLPEDGLDKYFMGMGRKYKIVGLEPKRHKNPLLVERDGKTFIMPLEALRNVVLTDL